MAPRKDGTAREAGAISLSQASTNFGHSSARLRRIKKLQFGIINPDELRQYSVTQAITVNGRKIPAGVTRYEVRIDEFHATCHQSIVCDLLLVDFVLWLWNLHLSGYNYIPTDNTFYYKPTLNMYINTDLYGRTTRLWWR
jgi:hypothetical protein